MGNTGPGTKDVQLLSGGPDSEAGPGSPSIGLEWVVWTAAPRTSAHPPCGPGRPCWPPWWAPRAIAASGPIRARFQLHFYKVSQNGQVSPKYVHKACHSPCFHFRLQKSPLEILRFPFLRAFSPKELMTLFWPDLGFLVKMTKCRPYVHTCARRGRSIPPRCHASKLAPVTPLLIELSAGPHSLILPECA